MAKNYKHISLSPLRIALIYLIVAGLWIITTDNLLKSFISDPQYLSTIQTYKGWFYVAVTSLGLYYLLKKYKSQLRTNELKLKNLIDDLRSEKELKDVLFERIPVLITIYDPDLHSFEVNDEFRKVVGWSNDEIKEQNINLLEECYPDFETREEVVEFMENPGVGWKEFTMVTKSGNEIPTSWTNIRLTDNTSVGIGIDMTEIKASQAKIRESRELLKKTFESLEESVIIVDPDNRTIVDCNRGTEKVFGYSPGELIGESTQKLHVSQEKYEEFDNIGTDALEKEGVFQTEFQMQKKDGTIFYSDHTVTLVNDEKGEVDKVVSAIRDITEQKEYEQQLKQRQERLLQSQKIGKIGDWEFDPKTEKIYWSPMMYKIYDRDPDQGVPTFEEIQSQYYGDDSDKHNQKVQEALDKGQPYDIDLQLNTDKGNHKYIRAMGIPVKDETGEVEKLLGIVQDITQRKKYEKELEERNAFIETTIDNLPIGVAVNLIDEGTATLTNKKFTEIYGWPEEVLKDVETFFEKVYPDEDYRAKIREQIQKDIASGNPENMQWTGIKITTQNDEQKIVNAKNIPIYDQNLMISTVIDVTEQIELEKELKKEKQRFELVADTTSDVIWELDVKNKRLWWHKGFEELFGYQPKDPEENFSAWSNSIHPDDREEVAKSSQQKLDSTDTEWKNEYRIIKADGSIAYLIDRARIIRNEEQEPIRMIGTMKDITERKLTQQKLLASKEKYRHLFENNPEPMWIFNPETLEFAEVNQAAINHYGYSEEEFLNMTLSDIRPPEDIEAMKEDVEKHRGTSSYSEEWTHLKKDGSRITVKISAADVQYADKTHRLVLINDVTEQKRMQEKIIQSIIEGEDRERKRIARELHDGLGQYLVAANMNFQSIEKQVEQLPEKREKQFQTGLSHLKKALSETRTIAYNLMPKAIADYGLRTAIKNLIQDFRDSTDINFEFSHNKKEFDLSHRTETNIYRILQEITSNAVRHSECSNISITFNKHEDKLHLEIEDDGIGTKLKPEDEEKGLGLRSIKTRVNSLNGDLDIKSEPGEGMKVSITLPNLSQLKTENYNVES